jgi:hypothetical protein
MTPRQSWGVRRAAGIHGLLAQDSAGVWGLFADALARDRRRSRAATHRAEPAAECLGALERRETTTDEELIPAGAVLIEQQDGRSAGIDASRRV